MDYKEEFTQLIEENRLDDARILLEKHKLYASEEPFYYGNMGWILNHMERYQEAEVFLRKGLVYFPEDGWIYSQLGFSLDRQGNIRDGLDALLKALQLGFDEPWLHGEIGWCYKELGILKDAITYFENGLLDDERNVWLLSQAAEAYYGLGDKETAEEYYVRSYRILPDEDARFDLARFYKACGEYDKEIQILQEIQHEHYQDWREFELGFAYFQKNEPQEALLHLLKALELGRDDTSERTLLGDVYRSLQRIRESDEQYNTALEYFEKALQKETDTYWIYQEMVWIAHKQQDWTKKLQYLERASEVKKDDLWLMFHYARCYSDLHDHVKAIAACEFCLQHGEEGREMQDLYAWNLGRSSQGEKAIAVLKKRIERFGGEAWNFSELGWNYTQLEDYKEAIRCFKKAYDLEPKNPLNCSMLGWCNLRLNQLDAALSLLLEARQLGRDDGWLHSAFGELYTEKQKYAQALEHYQKALEQGYNENWIKKEITQLEGLLEELNEKA